eukprot:15480281-Alexandrium_andersonii.AAC.1
MSASLVGSEMCIRDRALAVLATGPSPTTAGQGMAVSPGPGHPATGASAHRDSTITSGPSACFMRAVPPEAAGDLKFSSPAVPHRPQLGPAVQTGSSWSPSSSGSIPTSPRPAARTMAAAARDGGRAGRPSHAYTLNDA